jgi:hypothetical protein
VLGTIDRSEATATPSELQSGYKRLLNLAAEKPVHIKQRGGKPEITLVNKAAWHNAVIAKAWLSALSGVVQYAVDRVLHNSSTVCPSEFSWLRLYGENDVRAFVDELSGAILSVTNGTRTWDDVDAVVDEWCKSASLLEHTEILERFEVAAKELKGDH